MFTWHLKMKIGPGNIILLCKRCCWGYNKKGDYNLEDNNNNNNDISVPAFLDDKPRLKSRKSTQITEVVANKNRPVDIISFLGNDEWIIDDTGNDNTQSNILLGGQTMVGEQQKDNSIDDDDDDDLVLTKPLNIIQDEPEIELQDLNHDQQSNNLLSDKQDDDHSETRWK